MEEFFKMFNQSNLFGAPINYTIKQWSEEELDILRETGTVTKTVTKENGFVNEMLTYQSTDGTHSWTQSRSYRDQEQTSLDKAWLETKHKEKQYAIKEERYEDAAKIKAEIDEFINKQNTKI